MHLSGPAGDRIVSKFHVFLSVFTVSLKLLVLIFATFNVISGKNRAFSREIPEFFNSIY